MIKAPADITLLQQTLTPALSCSLNLTVEMLKMLTEVQRGSNTNKMVHLPHYFCQLQLKLVVKWF